MIIFNLAFSTLVFLSPFGFINHLFEHNTVPHNLMQFENLQVAAVVCEHLESTPSHVPQTLLFRFEILRPETSCSYLGCRRTFHFFIHFLEIAELTL